MRATNSAFDPNANQCHCQTCLGSKTCTGACKGLPACNSSIQDCGTRCCVGPCDGTSCCPSDRICSKKSNETAICCKPNETCINQPGGASSCCAGLVCGDPEKENEICCPPGTTCGTDPAGNPTCKTPRIYCPACRQRRARCNVLTPTRPPCARRRVRAPWDPDHELPDRHNRHLSVIGRRERRTSSTAIPGNLTKAQRTRKI